MYYSSYLKIGARSIRNVFELLKVRPQVVSVEAYNCNTSEDGGIGIGAALPYVFGLQILKLGNCKLLPNGCKV